MKMDILIPDMTNFEEQNKMSPPIKASISDRQTLDGLQRAETHLFAQVILLNIFLFGITI
jgi:hypothetical protein